ncbi:MAG: oligoendopeptidase F [Acidobacteria bacterium]|nr:oligoendopeptidase F [Acidobacteriota bacterium]
MEDRYVKERDRSKIPDRYKWDLGDIYPNDASWLEAKKKLIAEMPRISGFKGSLAESPEKLCACLDLVYSLRKECVRLACYAGMQSDLDTRNAACLAMDQEMGQIGSDLTTLYSFVEPEILGIGPETVSAFLDRDPGLGIYRHIFDDILRKKDHTGTEGEEKIIAGAGLMADSPLAINNVFSNADFPYPDVGLQDGTTVRLDPAAFSLYRRARNREDRRKVFASYLGKIREFRRTFGAQLSAEVRKNLFFTRARNYGSCLEYALDVHNIPAAVYRNLIDGVHANLQTLHRYLGIRKRLLGLDDLHYYDLYAPVVREVDLSYTFEEAVDHVLASLKPLGGDYLDIARRALSNRWIDVYHNEGKRSGAYSNGSAYDAHPYMLLNYNGKYEDVSTLTHELGHTMHSFLANRAQPYPLSGYSIFVAEVASTFNEALLLRYMLEIEKRDEVRLSLLCNHLDNARATVFRQVQFAEFELKIHETMESGAALTGDLLDSLYEETARKYYGHERGICIVDGEIKSEWALIPHFYYNFYVYQYATSYTASAALSERVLSGDKNAAAGYLDLLASGGSDYPIELLKKVGVDMTTPQPLEATLQGMNRIMDEIEKIAPASSARNS